MLKLHLGCGPHIKDGWRNYDLNPGKGGTVVDLRGYLPDSPNSVDFIFTEHFIEHISRADAVRLFTECFRVLKPGGVIRIITPDLFVLLDDYMHDKIDRWKEVWTPDSPCRMVNEGMREWGHTFLYDHVELRKVLREAGFNSVDSRMHQNSLFPALRGIDVRPDKMDIILEAQK